MKLIISVLLSTVLLLAGCTSVEERAEGTRIQAPLPKDVRSAVIQAQPMKEGALKNVKGLDDAPQFFARVLKSELIPRHPDWQIAVAGEKDAVSNPDLTVNTELLEVDGGDAALRFLVGFGAGAVVSRVKVSVVDRAGRELAASEISEHTSCPLGACAEDNEPLVRQNLKSLAHGTAQFITNPPEYEKRRGSGSESQ